MSDPTVSVAIITFNQDRYIAQAIRSVLAQRVDFGVEIIVGEDASTDSTREVLREVNRESAGRMTVIERDRNLGMQGNFAAIYSMCRGKYIAILEGDDYWLRRDKLALQVQAMEKNHHWSLCFHRAAKVGESGQPCGAPFPGRTPRETTTRDILVSNYVPTCSIVLRRSALPALPDWWCEMSIGDWPLCILASERGVLGFLPEVMACYRLHEASSYSSTARIRQYERSVAMANVLCKYMAPRHERDLAMLEARLRLGQASEMARLGRHEDAASAVIEAVELAFASTRARSQRHGGLACLKRVISRLPIPVSVFILLSFFGLARRVT